MTKAQGGRAVLSALLLALCVTLPRTANAGSTASVGSPARLSVAVPAAARDAGVVMLEIGISATRRSSGHVGAAVRLRRSDGSGVELGRISVAPGTQRYQLNVAGALKRTSGGSAEIEVELIDRGSGGPLASGAELTVGTARIVTR